MTRAVPSVGIHLREWRGRRRMSQLELALDAGISQKHLSFVESGRAVPSREMVLLLAAHLDVPLRERNLLLLAAGYAPLFPERPLDDPALRAAREAVELILVGHEPCPALAVDRHWVLISANAALTPLLAAVADGALLQPPVNVLRLSLHPRGLAPAIANLPEWRAHLLERLRRQVDITADRVLIDLARELAAYPGGTAPPGSTAAHGGVLVPLRLRHGPDILSFFSTTTVFGTPVDITLAELALEAFYPADPATARALRRMAGQGAEEPVTSPADGPERRTRSPGRGPPP